MPAPRVHAFIQARMSSSRFPGKVLAPFLGRPLIAHVLERAAKALDGGRVVLATSTDASDDPLCAYARELGAAVFRGPREDVFGRFRLCLAEHPCDWFFRVCADSPLLDGTLLTAARSRARDSDVDIVTNVRPRSFPRGRSVELLRAARFASIDRDGLSPEQKEHLTKVYYDSPRDYRILNIESGDPSLAGVSLTVDTVEDLRRLEAEARQGAWA